MSRNVSGQAYALTVVTPILDGHVQELTEHLEALPEGPGSPLARVPGTHLARWVVMVEGLDAETVAGACEAALDDEALTRHGAAPDRSLAVYRLVYALGG